MATCHPPKLLLLDEPTAALDPAGALRLLRFMLRYIAQHQMTTVMVTQDQTLAGQLGNRLWRLDKGRLTADVAEISARASVMAEAVPCVDYASLLGMPYVTPTNPV